MLLSKASFPLVLFVVVTLGVIWNEFFIYNYFMSSCNRKWSTFKGNDDKHLDVLMIADTHLLGQYQGHWLDKLRREWQMSTAYRAAISYLTPEAVFFLGDLMDEGQWTDENLFNRYCDRFFRLFSNETDGTPMYMVPGNHDLGFHYELLPQRLQWFRKRFHADPVNMITIKGFNFISINSMSMHGDNCSLCYSSEKQVKVYSDLFHCVADPNCKKYEEASKYRPYIRPILLQHFPLFRKNENDCVRDSDFDYTAHGRDEVYREKWECLSQDATKFLLDALQPRAVFNGHAHRGCKKQWTEPVEFWEYTVNSFNWRNNDRPTLLMVTINNEKVLTRTCNLPPESLVITLYVLLALLVLLYICYSIYACLRYRRYGKLPENSGFRSRKCE